VESVMKLRGKLVCISQITCALYSIGSEIKEKYIPPNPTLFSASGEPSQNYIQKWSMVPLLLDQWCKRESTLHREGHLILLHERSPDWLF